VWARARACVDELREGGAHLEKRVARAHHRLAGGRCEEQLDQRDPMRVRPPVTQVGGAAAAVRLGLVDAAAEGGRLVLATLQGAHLQHVGLQLQPGCTGLRREMHGRCMGLRPRPRSAAGRRSMCSGASAHYVYSL
jgi:hypothetical protein